MLRNCVFVFILIYTGCANKYEVDLTECPNRIVDVKNLEISRGYIIINDSLILPASYFSRDWNGFDDAEMAVLRGNLHVNDILLLGPNPLNYVVRKRKGVKTRYAIGEYRNLEFDK